MLQLSGCSAGKAFGLEPVGDVVVDLFLAVVAEELMTIGLVPFRGVVFDTDFVHPLVSSFDTEAAEADDVLSAGDDD